MEPSSDQRNGGWSDSCRTKERRVAAGREVDRARASFDPTLVEIQTTSTATQMGLRQVISLLFQPPKNGTNSGAVLFRQSASRAAWRLHRWNVRCPTAEQ